MNKFHPGVAFHPEFEPTTPLKKVLVLEKIKINSCKTEIISCSDISKNYSIIK